MVIASRKCERNMGSKVQPTGIAKGANWNDGHVSGTRKMFPRGS